MTIHIRKSSPYRCAYTITRANGSTEVIELDTKTFLLHDITHYVVERKPRYTSGFWGLLAQGHAFADLFGKDNPISAELRAVEKIVGPMQSAAAGNIRTEDLPTFIAHLDSHLPQPAIADCLAEISAIQQAWEQLPIGQRLMLRWELPASPGLQR